MSTCARCGDPACQWHYELKVHGESSDLEALACVNRELANLRSLLRSVTRRLEVARELLDPDGEPSEWLAAAREIDAVLEALA